MDPPEGAKRSRLGRAWWFFWRPSTTFGWGALVILGAIGGVVFWGGFNTFMEYTNTLEFCVSCHEMEQTVYQEYKRSNHFTNRTGVRVICSDCHVPKDWTAKLVRKVRATNELFHKLIGTIDTREKFEANRLEMAERVWASMESSDSRECRNCHSFQAMNMDVQGRRPQKKHPEAMKAGKTCIECHKGVAHKLPKSQEDDD
jgi:nitrate/TMAO reductase-like tetraheme cytochrome c subunit